MLYTQIDIFFTKKETHKKTFVGMELYIYLQLIR